MTWMKTSTTNNALISRPQSIAHSSVCQEIFRLGRIVFQFLAQANSREKQREQSPGVATYGQHTVAHENFPNLTTQLLDAPAVQ
jgi:hypothetical protein